MGFADWLKESKKGPTSIFGPKGKLALMFLKHYGGCSDKRLVQQLNGNLEWQFFCEEKPLKSKKVVHKT